MLPKTQPERQTAGGPRCNRSAYAAAILSSSASSARTSRAESVDSPRGVWPTARRRRGEHRSPYPTRGSAKHPLHATVSDVRAPGLSCGLDSRSIQIGPPLFVIVRVTP